jgi:transcription elongation factor SPT5
MVVPPLMLFCCVLLRRLQIKSVFCTSTPGYIYIEAMNEPFAREAITGLQGVYYSTLRQVPIPEMSMLLTLTVKKKPIKEGQWCRLRRGPNKGDLARVLRLLEGGTRGLVQVVPRPDYDPAARKGGGTGAARPLQRLFQAETAKSKGHEVERKRNPITGEFNEFWNNDYYSRGYLFKEVKVDTFLVHANNPLPRLEEMTLFQEKKREGEEGDGEDEDEGGEGRAGSWNSKQGILKELARLEEESSSAADQRVAFRAGDTVQVMEGEQRNLRGVVVSVNERTGLAVVQPLSEYQLGPLTIEASLLIKYIRPGAHVKVLSGQHLGQTGRVVSVYRSDGDNIAAILTDGVNTEITVNMGHLQVTSEVTTGLNSLGGYELYDLLVLNANDYGVVVFVGTEHLSVLTVNDVLKEVRPMEVKGKRAPARGATGAFDHLKNPLAIGDTVSVVQGKYAKKTGTVKHINRSVLWLHSTSHLINSGIFVEKGKSCLLAGSKIKGSGNTAATLLNAAFNTDAGATLIRTQAFRKGGGKGGGQDEEHGKAVKLTQGGHKGHLGRIVDSTNTHYSVELHGRMKVVNVLKSKVRAALEEMRREGGGVLTAWVLYVN